MSKIPFNKPHLTTRELDYIKHAHELGQFSGDGYYTKLCNKWFAQNYGQKSLLTHSCTAALEMSAILADIGPGDEVIMPSYTFVSTANAVVLRGGVPVFIDIEEKGLNIDIDQIEKAITPKTKAIMVVHYAGGCCDMDKVVELAKAHELLLLEDAAQGFFSLYKGRLLGTIGDVGCLSFHETKNIISGEGGAILINKKEFQDRAEIIREKGTNRSLFFRGQVDKYTWVDIGSSYLPGEVVAAFLFAQLEDANSICDRRIDIWNTYNKAFEALEKKEYVSRPWFPDYVKHNGHMFYLITRSLEERTALIGYLNAVEIFPVFHYIPLHTSPAGKRYGRFDKSLPVTDSLSDRIVRLPLYFDMSDIEIQRVVETVYAYFANK